MEDSALARWAADPANTAWMDSKRPARHVPSSPRPACLSGCAHWAQVLLGLKVVNDVNLPGALNRAASKHPGAQQPARRSQLCAQHSLLFPSRAAPAVGLTAVGWGKRML